MHLIMCVHMHVYMHVYVCVYVRFVLLCITIHAQLVIKKYSIITHS
jgi:hypothetical protein